MAIQTLTLNVNAQPSAEDRAFLYLSQNENGRDIRFRILGDDLPSGCTATLSGVKPDGNVWSKAGTVTNNFVVVEEDIQMTAVAGRWDAQLDIVNGSKNIVTALIRITVEAAAVEAGAVPSDTQLEGYVEQCKQYAETAKNEAYGSPLTAATAAAMTDQSRVYVYTGSETGYTAGHWYYHNGSAWTDGGVYNAVAVDTDTTLSVSGKAADAKKTGDELNTIKEDLSDIFDKTGVVSDITNSIVLNDGRRIGTVNGVSSSTIYPFSDTGFISCEGYDTLNISMPIALVAYDFGLAFYTTDSEASFIANSGVAVNYDTSLSEMSSEIRTISIPSTAKYFRTTWIKSTDASYQSNTFNCTLIKTGTLEDEIANVEGDLVTVTENRLNPNTVTSGKYVNLSGSLKTDTNYAVTDFIAVSEGEVIGAVYRSNSNIRMRFVAAFDSNKSAISASGAENVYTYTVPSDVAYLRISGAVARMTSDTARIGESTIVPMYQPYFSGKNKILTAKNRTDIQNMLLYPLTKLPSYILGALAYRPLGQLSKGYVCFVSDDGDAELATYTIPMFEAKGVPLTMAVMSNSEVFTDADNAETYTATVVDAVTNHGCEIAQHGGTAWTSYDEYMLNKFFDEEEEFFTSIGLTAYGAVCPQHYINDTIRVVAGGRFGCVRTGYSYASPYYANYLNGARSNIFGLSSQSVIDSTLASHTAVLDTVKANNMLRIMHFHENELDADTKAQLEGIIDYAKEIGLTFITMKDIPWII